MSRMGLAVELWSESARPLIRTAAALARSMNSSWAAIVVYGPAHRLSDLSEEQRQLIADNTNLITWLGGTPFFCEGEDVAHTLLSAVKLTGVDMLILGRPQGRGFSSRLFGDHVSTRLLHCGGNISLIFAAYPQACEDGG